MTGGNWLAFIGGTAVASAFHEYGHHDWTLSTTLATIVGAGVLAWLVVGNARKAKT